MFGSIKSLKPGVQGGGLSKQQRRDEADRRPDEGSKQKPRSGRSEQQRAHGANALDEAIRKTTVEKHRYERNQKQKYTLPDWIRVGEKVGYVSQSTGRTRDVFVDNISTPDAVVKIVFVDDRSVWKGIPFTWILSSKNPLRQLVVKSTSRAAPAPAPAQNLRQLVETAEIDKSDLMGRVVGKDTQGLASPVEEPLVGAITLQTIPDSSIVASSYFMNNPKHGFSQMWRARIDNVDLCWRANVDNKNQCLRFDLGGPKLIVKVWTKGNYIDNSWVKTFTISYTADGQNWNRRDKVFQGNEDMDGLAESLVDPPITATSVKLHPLTWHKNISMRAELLGFSIAPEEELPEGATFGPSGPPSFGPSGPPGDADSDAASAGRSRSRSPRRD